MFAHFQEYHRNHEKIRVYMVLQDTVIKLQTFTWIFKYVPRVITWSLFNFRAPNLAKQPISPWPFIWWCQFINQFKFETCPSSLCNFEMANSIDQKIPSVNQHWVISKERKHLSSVLVSNGYPYLFVANITKSKNREASDKNPQPKLNLPRFCHTSRLSIRADSQPKPPAS